MTPVPLQLLLHLHNTIFCQNKHRVIFPKNLNFYLLIWNVHPIKVDLFAQQVAAQMNVCSCLSGSGGLLSWRQQAAAAGSSRQRPHSPPPCSFPCCRLPRGVNFAASSQCMKINLPQPIVHSRQATAFPVPFHQFQMESVSSLHRAFVLNQLLFTLLS